MTGPVEECLRPTRVSCMSNRSEQRSTKTLEEAHLDLDVHSPWIAAFFHDAILTLHAYI